MSRSVCRGTIFLLAIVGLIAQAPAAAPPPLHRPTTVGATGSQVLQIAVEFLRRGQRLEAERLFELLSADPNSGIRNEARFRLATMASGIGKYAKAAELLRRILDENPKAARVRLELAGVLSKMGDEDGSLRQLRALRTADLPPNVARFADRLSASLQERKPLGFHLELAIAPDTNINRAASSDTLGTVLGDFTINQKAKSGVGAAARGLVQARLPISSDLQLVARATGDASIYRDSMFNDITLDFAAGPEVRSGRNRLAAEIGVGQQWYGMKPYERTEHLAGSVTRPLGSVSQLRLDVAGRLTSNTFNELQGGRGIGARLSYERALSPEVLLSVFAGVDRFKAKNDAYSTKAWNLSLTAYRDLGRATFSAGIEIGRLKADERLLLLPRAREDKLIRFSLGAVFRRFAVGGFAPTMRLVVERNRSSVEFYDYRRVRSELGIARAF